MGQLVNLKCNKCGYETNLSIGSGIAFNNLEKVITLFDKETREQIRGVVNKSGNRLWYVYKEIGRCEKCGKISAIAVFKTTDAERREIVFNAKCQCGSSDIQLYDSEKIFEGKENVFCPICAEKLAVTEQGHWD